MFDVFAITVHYVYKVTPPFADTLFKERLWQLLSRSDFLVLARWNFCSGKPFPAACSTPQTAYSAGFRSGLFGGHNVMFDSMNDIFMLIASGGVRWRAILRPVVIDASCPKAVINRSINQSIFY